jgi:hypothetical protein
MEGGKDGASEVRRDKMLLSCKPLFPRHKVWTSFFVILACTIPEIRHHLEICIELLSRRKCLYNTNR